MNKAILVEMVFIYVNMIGPWVVQHLFVLVCEIYVHRIKRKVSEETVLQEQIE